MTAAAGLAADEAAGTRARSRRSGVPAALLLAVSTYPPMLPRGVVTRWSSRRCSPGWAGGWAGAAVAWAVRLGTAGAAATAVWLTVTLGIQDAQRADLGMPVVGWVAVATATGAATRTAPRGARS